jgi:UDP:flavonoid glycosyltransferase YjiC (YdhE family)
MSRTSVRRKVLFFAEAVTLAHIGRPLALAAALGAEEFEVALACDQRAAWALAGFRGRVLPIRSISSAQFLHALAVGRPVYDEATLTAYAEEDLKLLEYVRPDVVVGDFRLSLSVSARRAGVRYLAISNAYWSPYFAKARYVIPNHPATRFVPVGLASAFFRVTRPAFFALHSRPLNRVRRRFGMPSLGGDLRHIYTDADEVLYADVPQLFPLVNAPPTHEFVGPIIWAPPVAPPEWWTSLPINKPLVYMTLGSSGRPELLDQVLAALGPLDVTVVAATVNDQPLRLPPENAKVAPYLPGHEAAKRAQLVICNGGSPTSQQALAAGVPVIGIASNLDQFLNMQAIEEAGAGVLMRSDRFVPARLTRAVERTLRDGAFHAAARQIACWFEGFSASRRFEAAVQRACPMG